MRKLIITFALALSAQLLSGQIYSFDQTSSKLTISGTSTLHDWISTVESFSGKATYDENDVVNISFTAKVESIKSGKPGMDKNTYKAMKSSSFPNISFESQKMSVSGISLTGIGGFTIAGITKELPVTLGIEKWNEDSFQVIGEVKLTMSEFGIDPPTAMLGAIKTGDDIVIGIEFLLTK